jgi:hypothetical protein
MRLSSYVAPLAVAAAFTASPALAESRTYVISWFSLATNSTAGDCSKGVNPPVEEQYLRNLGPLGYTPEQIAEFRKKQTEGDEEELNNIMRMRGRMNGQPVNPFANPEFVHDPNLNTVDAKHAYGFDLDGDGTNDPDGFTEVNTGEPGIDNQLYRALGCSDAFRGSLSGRPTYWDWGWGQLRDSQPAWIMTVTGDDLSKDGEVTVTFDRALEYIRSNADGSPKFHATYRIDPDQRSHNEFRGQIKGGVLSLPQPGEQLRLLQNPLVTPEWRMKHVMMRLDLRQNGTVGGMVGGYQPWGDMYFALAQMAPGAESCITGDVVGLYYSMKKHADGDRDPKTGQHMSISATYYIEAVPAFAVPSSPRADKVVAR